MAKKWTLQRRIKWKFQNWRIYYQNKHIYWMGWTADWKYQKKIAASRQTDRNDPIWKRETKMLENNEQQLSDSGKYYGLTYMRREWMKQKQFWRHNDRPFYKFGKRINVQIQGDHWIPNRIQRNITRQTFVEWQLIVMKDRDSVTTSLNCWKKKTVNSEFYINKTILQE